MLLAMPSHATLPKAQPADANMRSDRLDAIPGIVQEGLENELMPGCVVMIGRRGKIVYHEAFGHRQLIPTPQPMQPDTVFDMASITKPVATATSVMMLVERGKLRLRDRVTAYVPDFGVNGKQRITLTQLLTHQAGFIPDNAVADYDGGRADAFRKIHALGTTYDPGTRFVYSDVGFILLDDLIERQSGQTVHEFSQANLFQPLGMHETGYLPAPELRERAATTEEREGRWMLGEVHDPRAWRMGGVAGHAGLFSTASDLAVYAQMMLNGGHYAGKRILAKSTVEMMSRSHRIVEGQKVSIRGLGWDKLTGYSSNRGENMSDRAFGHGGFTGTVLWIDPAHDLFFIFLSNRVHPNGKGSINRLAGRIATVAVSAIDDDLSGTESETESDSRSAVRSQDDNRISDVRTGIDQLIASGFETLKGQRVGLITNQTGITRDGTSTIEALKRSPNVNLVALFSPEHGLAGKLDQSQISDSTRDGLQVFSLYGETRVPTKAQLDSIDTLLFDIQDIGCRYYTYISTMGLAMEAAAQHGKRFVVLDRPNPIRGDRMGGPMLDAGRESFVGFHSLPIQHGMTVGELARMFKTERDLTNLKLEVIPCTSWRRNSYFDEAGLPWINPSPNMRNLNQAILYPAIGVWEMTNISVGRGTDTPFEILGAPWISGIDLGRKLNAANLPGVQFTPKWFVPNASRFAGQKCGGVQISLTDRDEFNAAKLAIEMGRALYSLHGDQWQAQKSLKLLGHAETLESILAGTPTNQICSELERQLAPFRARREKYLLYR